MRDIGGFLEQAVKQRLVGVAVLAAFAAMLLPVVFDAERPPGVQVTEVIPPVPEYPPVVTPDPTPVDLPVDRPAPEPTPVDEMYQMANDEQSEVVQPAAMTPATIPPATSPPASQPASATKAKPSANDLPPLPAAPGGKLDATGVPESWVVQVAAMSDPKKADSLIADLKLKGYPAFSHVTRDAKGDTIRIFVGPKLDKAQAAKLKQKLDREMGAQTMLKPFKPK
jgi:DedD protein